MECSYSQHAKTSFLSLVMLWELPGIHTQAAAEKSSLILLRQSGKLHAHIIGQIISFMDDMSTFLPR